MNTKTKDHPELSELFNQDEQRVNWHDETLWWIRQKRDKSAHGIPEWETLREKASQIKNNALSNLADYLVSFEERALANGIIVHWAADAAEHNQIVHGILQKHGISKMVKSKSMLTEECHLNEYLEKQGLEVIDSDLGERIVQLAKEPPSHIVLPCIHKKKRRNRRSFPSAPWCGSRDFRSTDPYRSSQTAFKRNIPDQKSSPDRC